MKKLSRITLVLLISFFTGSVAFASFPYSKDAKTDKTEVVQADSIVLEETTIEKESINSSQTDEEFIITLVLWFFLGLLAAHRWYREKPVIWNILFILTFGGCGIWLIADLINILIGNF